MRSVWYTKILARLDEKQKDAVSHILQGGPQDYPTYKYYVGFLDGLKAALECAEDVDNEATGGFPNAPRSAP